MENRKKKVLLVDGHSILNRAFYGMPDLTNAKGVHTGAVYGFLNILFSQLDELRPDYLAVAFDLHAPTFRHEAYEAYKGTRKAMPDELRQQVPLIKKMLGAMGIAIFEQAGLEADDILGTLAKKSEERDMDVVILSGDRDLLQTATKRVCVRIPRTKKGQTVIDDFHSDQVLESYGVTPRQFIDVKALMGDASDNIPGVPKVGEKTATQLIRDYGSLDGVYENLSQIKKPALHKNLAENEDKARMSLFLATIKTDCDVELDEAKAEAGDYYTKEAFALCTELGFKNFLPRFDRAVTEEKKEESGFSLVERESAFPDLLKKLSQADVIGLWPVYDRAGYGMEKSSVLLGAALSCAAAAGDVGGTRQEGPIGAAPEQKEAGDAEQRDQKREDIKENFKTDNFLTENFKTENFFIRVSSIPVSGPRDAEDSVSEAGLRAFLKQIRTAAGERSFQKGGSLPGGPSSSAKSTSCPGGQAGHGCGNLAVFAQKEHMPLWNFDTEEEFGACLRGGGRMGDCLDGTIDLLVCAYLANPLKSDYEIEDVANEYLGISLQSRKQLFGKKSWEQAMEEDADAVMAYACRAAQSLSLAAPLVEKKLREMDMWELYTQIERPLTYILYDMERIGIRICPQALKDYSDSLGSRISELEQKIYEETGEVFNIASPKQLGEVLFEKMLLPGGKKTKTGFSTAADVLEKLAPDYPVVGSILEYRGLTKLRSTYADGLMAYVADDERIHTTLKQTITATGRISSTDPNLQNIPMKTDLGRQIRKAFIPREGFSFTDADYSQIELRILAHMSGDPGLIEAYRDSKDIHRITASRVFHTPFEEVTPLQRRNAKAVNFGIVYGISSFGLSQGLSISRQEAAEYIKAYFKTYPGIKRFLDGLVTFAKKNGFAKTMYGRRRPVPELSSSNFMQRSFGERVAMNSPIQGSAADIMKIAMIRVWERILREKLRSRLILQIHDELLIETAPGEEEQAARILEEEMEHAADLAVRLETDVSGGADWYMAK